MNVILENVRHRQATKNTKYYCLYNYYVLGIKRSHLAIIYCKSKTTISSWIAEYERSGAFGTGSRQATFPKFDHMKRKWITDLYEKLPTLYLDEAKQRFTSHFGVPISVSSICKILHAHGLSWKVLERRAIQIRESEVVKYSRELCCFQWDHPQLVFLDEVSFDNRDMWRTRGYGLIGQKVVYKGEFRRRPRVSTLCFLGYQGILDSFETEGTFTRQKFFDACRKMALTNGNIRSYPGQFSVWIMDGARIHCDKNIIKYLRSLGIIPIFLPPYCPFYNPVEIVFGLIKRYVRRHYEENKDVPMSVIVGAALTKFTSYDCTNLFRKCGYFPGGVFDPSVSK